MLESTLKTARKVEKHGNQDSHLTSSPVSQASFFEKLCCLILASSQRKLRGYIELKIVNVTKK